jgi:hypothetical protein
MDIGGTAAPPPGPAPLADLLGGGLDQLLGGPIPETTQGKSLCNDFESTLFPQVQWILLELCSVSDELKCNFINFYFMFLFVLICTSQYRYMI